MKRPNTNTCYQSFHSTSSKSFISSSHIHKLKIPKPFQKTLNAPYALFPTMLILGIILWMHSRMWNNSREFIARNNIIMYNLYAKHTRMLLNHTLETNQRRRIMESHPIKASWDLLGSLKTPSLYAKFMLDEEVYNLEVDTGSFLTWFRCDYKLYQDNIVSCTDPYCQVVTGKHFTTVCSLENDKDSCVYAIVYEDNSRSGGFLVKSNIHVHALNYITGASIMHIAEAYLGCSYEDSNPVGEYKDIIDGLLGLGRSAYGVQLSFSKLQIPFTFGYCFEDFFDTKEEKKVGYLFFGELGNLHSNTEIKWVNIPELYIFGDESYELRVSELWIDEEVKIPIDANMMLDTGAPLTFMEIGLFDTIIHYISESALAAGYTIYEEEINHFKCWKFPEPLDESIPSVDDTLLFDFPVLRFTFSNGVALQISPTKYLALYAFIQDGVCANMRKFDDGMDFPHNTMVLGSRMMAEYLMVFDNEKDRIGFMPSPNCQFSKKRKFVHSDEASSQAPPKHIRKDESMK